ncbi:MAG: hypothetical protein QOG03_1827 [Actinomycetota bacterium]|jgi:hypothetical protein|nr:hypothetical protein [Actinomycetota bacterium]
MDATGTDTARFRRAISAIDALNAGDPNSLDVRGDVRPKALGEAELATEWIERLVTSPSEGLLLATRAHHLRRWEIPRATYPEGRNGYLRWKRDLHKHHVEAVGRVLAHEGYGAEDIARVQDIVRKKGINRTPDAEVQALEDALCLVFIETQYAELAAKVDDDVKMSEIVDKTLEKMSERGRAFAAALMG